MTGPFLLLPPLLPSPPTESEIDVMTMAMTPTVTTRILTRTPPMLSSAHLMPPSAGPPPPASAAAVVHTAPPSGDVRPAPTWWHSTSPFRALSALATTVPRAPTITAFLSPAIAMIQNALAVMLTAADRRNVITAARISVGGTCWANAPSIMALRNRATVTTWGVGGPILVGPRRIRRRGNC